MHPPTVIMLLINLQLTCMNAAIGTPLWTQLMTLIIAIDNETEPNTCSAAIYAALDQLSIGSLHAG